MHFLNENKKKTEQKNKKKLHAMAINKNKMTVLLRTLIFFFLVSF